MEGLSKEMTVKGRAEGWEEISQVKGRLGRRWQCVERGEVGDLSGGYGHDLGKSRSTPFPHGDQAQHRADAGETGLSRTGRVSNFVELRRKTFN